MRGVAISTDTGIWERNAVTHLNHRRHFFQVDLVHDAVTSRNHIHILKRGTCPINKVETVFVTAFFDGAVFGKSVWIIATTFNSQRMVNDQLGRDHWVDFSWVTALFCNRITQTCQIHQRSLT